MTEATNTAWQEYRSILTEAMIDRDTVLRESTAEFHHIIDNAVYDHRERSSEAWNLFNDVTIRAYHDYTMVLEKEYGLGPLVVQSSRELPTTFPGGIVHVDTDEAGATGTGESISKLYPDRISSDPESV